VSLKPFLSYLISTKADCFKKFSYPIGKDTGCTVSVLLNDVKPYQKTVAMGHGGKGDYSVWHYNITHKYASLNLI
jgi:hypothetical protein